LPLLYHPESYPICHPRISIFRKDDGSLVIFMMQFGQPSDFKAGMENFIMMGAWQNHRENAKSYDI